ncbi:MAG: ribonuclease R [Eubacteriales bacterium]|nr:ribonuclease R [Eubacteriales bacterium]
MNFKEKILSVIAEAPRDFLTLLRALEIGNTRFERDALSAALDELVRQGELVISAKKKYALPSQLGLRRGTLRGNERGFAFFIDDEEGAPVLFIPHKSLHGALHGDAVLARRVETLRSDDEGEIVGVLRRANETVVGTYRRPGLVEPDERRLGTRILIRGRESLPARERDKVVVRVTRFFNDGERLPEGVVTRVLGSERDKGVDMLSVAASHGFSLEFEDDVLAEAAAVSAEAEPTDEQRAGRLDLTGETIFTIDGAYSKDFDDAVSIESLAAGRGWRLGVHIADVSEYVCEGGALDQEARIRGTSVYPVGTVVPMLPESLSNGICSLNEGVVRLTLSVFMTVSPDGRIANDGVYRSFIRSRRRLVYDDVSAALNDPSGPEAAALADLMPDLLEMDAAARALAGERARRGGIDMEIAEASFTLDEKGRAVDVRPRVQGRADAMIEQFMLAANETVAEMCCYAEMPILYRVHEQPEEGKLRSFTEFCSNLGIPIRGAREEIHPGQLADVLTRAEEKGLRPLVSRIMLRAMSKARYSEKNMGHFGLSLRNYCHFTSPIRRYPDLYTHRVLKLLLDGKAEEAERYGTVVHELGVSCSECERRAMEAERDADDVKKAEYISRYLGECYDGVISGITETGIFVEIPANTVEGMIRIQELPYRCLSDPEHYRANFPGRDRTVRLGDAMRVVIVGADCRIGKVEMVPDEEWFKEVSHGKQ